MLYTHEIDEEQKSKFVYITINNKKKLNFNLSPEVIFPLSMKKHRKKN